MQIKGWGQQPVWSLPVVLSILTPDFHHEHGAKVTVKVKTTGQSEDLSVVLKSDSFFPPCSDSPCLPLTCAAASTRLYTLFAAERSPSSVTLSCPAGWQTNTAELLPHTSSLCLLQTPSPSPPSWTPQLAPCLCNAASSLQQAWGLLDQSPLSSPLLCLTQGILYGLIYLPSLPFLSCSEAELLTSSRFHDHSWAGSLRQTAVEDRYKNPKATQMHLI